MSKREEITPVMYGNATVDNFQVGFLGEQHSPYNIDPSWNVIKKFIIKHYRLRDIFLVEGSEKGKRPSLKLRWKLKQTRGIPFFAKQIGWNNMDAVKSVNFLAGMGGGSVERDAIFNIHIPRMDASLLETISEVRERYPNRRIWVSAGLGHAENVYKQVQSMGNRTLVVDATRRSR